MCVGRVLLGVWGGYLGVFRDEDFWGGRGGVTCVTTVLCWHMLRHTKRLSGSPLLLLTTTPRTHLCPPGQELDCQVVSVDVPRCRVGLSLKAMQSDPLRETMDSIQVRRGVRVWFLGGGGGGGVSLCWFFWGGG